MYPSTEVVKILTDPPCVEFLKKRWEPKPGDWAMTDWNEVVLVYHDLDGLVARTETYGITCCVGPEYHEVGMWLPGVEDFIKPGGLLEQARTLKGINYYTQDAFAILHVYFPPTLLYGAYKGFGADHGNLHLACTEALRWLLTRI